MKTDKQKALEWFERYVIGSDPILITDSQFHKWREPIEAIRKALQEPVDLEALKKDESLADTVTELRILKGWNDCLDHLREKGII